MARRNVFALVAVVLAASLIGSGCKGKDASGTKWPVKPGPKVVVTFPPLHSFVKSVVGDHGTVRTILATTGPHDYHENFRDAEMLDGADLFFQNGLNLEGSLLSTIKKAKPNAKVKFVDLGGRLDEKTLLAGDEHGHEGHGHAHGPDPHVWLGIDHVKQMVLSIRDELKAADPPHAADYDKNTAAYLTELDALRDEGKKLLADVPPESRKFVTMHDSLAYFAKAFDLKIAGVIELVPGQEPSAKELNELIAACQKHAVRVVALEPQYSAAAGGKTLERELKAKGIRPVLIEIDPLETASPDELSADLYVKTMRSNLKALAEALKAK